MRNDTLRSTLAVIAIVTVTPGSLGGATLRVPIDYSSPQAAIDAAQDGDTVIVAPGVYEVTEPIAFRGTAVHVTSEAGPGTTTLRMGKPRDGTLASVVIFDEGKNGAVLEGFTVTGGAGTQVEDSSASCGIDLPVLHNVGGGILLRPRSSAVLIDCRIIRNRANAAAGVLCLDASVTLVRCEVGENQAQLEFGAGGIQASGDCHLVLEDCAIHGNHGDRGGGMAVVCGAFAAVSGTTFEENHVSGGGQGAGVFINNAAVHLSDCTLRQNVAADSDSSDGGALYARGSADVDLTRCVITKNQARGNAGALFLAGSSNTRLRDCRLEENGSSQGGISGVFVCEQATVSLEGCRLSRHYNDDISRNLVGYDTARLSLVNCLIGGQRNNAFPGDGQAIDLHGSASLDLVHCTLAFGPPMNGSGTVLAGTAGTVVTGVNSILWGTTGEGLASAGSVSLTHCIVAGAAAPPGEGNSNGDPLFVGEDDFHLKPGSPALDAGLATASPDRDLEGTRRPCGPGVDIGAFEAGGCPLFSFRRGDADGDASLNVTDALVVLLHLFSGRSLPCVDSGDVDDDGRLGVTDPLVLLRYLFSEGPPPAAPFPVCEIDPTPDMLGCEEPACP